MTVVATKLHYTCKLLLIRPNCAISNTFSFHFISTGLSVKTFTWNYTVAFFPKDGTIGSMYLSYDILSDSRTYTEKCGCWYSE